MLGGIIQFSHSQNTDWAPLQRVKWPSPLYQVPGRNLLKRFRMPKNKSFLRTRTAFRWVDSTRNVRRKCECEIRLCWRIRHSRTTFWVFKSKYNMNVYSSFGVNSTEVTRKCNWNGTDTVSYTHLHDINQLRHNSNYNTILSRFSILRTHALILVIPIYV